MKTIIVLIAILGLVGLLVAILFIIQHWPYGHIILDISVVGIALSVFLALRLKK